MIITFNQLNNLAKKNKGKRIALCHGAFAMLHYGHIELLSWAKQQCDVLVVSITANEFVDKERIKLFTDGEKAQLIDTLACVDYVVIDYHKTGREIIKHLSPDVYIKGHEYSIKQSEALQQEMTLCKSVIFSPHPKRISSTNITDYITEAIDIYTDKQRIDCILYSIARYKFVYRLLYPQYTVLDCGCGFGYGTKLLSLSGASVIGCDINKDCINTSKNYFPDLDFVCGDICTLDLPKFDIIVCMDVIEHIENTKKFLQRIKNLTKKFAIFSTPQKLPYEKRSDVRKTFHIREYDYDSFKDILGEVFNTVCIFTQTDEIVSSGNPEVAWTYIAMCF